MEFLVEVWSPRHSAQTISSVDLDEAYNRVSGRESATFTWNDLGSRVIIVSVGDNYSTASMLNDSTWYYLQEQEDEELVEIDLGGQPTEVPKGIIASRDVGLAVLKGADDLDGLLRDYAWIEQ